jgi:hypothetical protein
MRFAGTGGVDVYAVGVLSALQRAYRSCRAGRWSAGRAELRSSVRYLGYQARRGEWRAVRQSFNGYLAEPAEFPPGDYRRRCGSGWTKRRALRSLDRHLP